MWKSFQISFLSHYHVLVLCNFSLSYAKIHFYCRFIISHFSQRDRPQLSLISIYVLQHTHWRLPTPVFLGFPGDSVGKESACNAGDLGLIPGLGRSFGEGNSYPLQYSGLENPKDFIVHGVSKSLLSNFHFTSLLELGSVKIYGS